MQVQPRIGVLTPFTTSRAGLQATKSSRRVVEQLNDDVASRRGALANPPAAELEPDRRIPQRQRGATMTEAAEDRCWNCGMVRSAGSTLPPGA
jgi:hypothetical protein